MQREPQAGRWCAGLVLCGLVLALHLGSAAARPTLAAGGIALGWGSNVSGQAGARSGISISRPTQLTTAAGGTTFTAIAAGQYHSLALDGAGSAWAWGDNVFGQIGQQGVNSSALPLQVQGFGAAAALTAVAAGGYHSLALDGSGAVWAWGFNGAGQLGDGSTRQRNGPVQVAGFPAGTVITAIAAGYAHSLALDSSGNVWAWGLNDSGQLGVPGGGQSSVPVQVTGLPAGTPITAIAAGGYHSLALDSSGNVWAWGSDLFGQLGDGGTADSSVPVQVIGAPGGTVFTAVAAGYDHSLALDASGRLWSWGIANRGQLGEQSALAPGLPGVVRGLPASNTRLTAIAAGGYHSLALDSSGSVWAWGDDDSGQLGTAGMLLSTVPLKVATFPAGTSIIAIAAGGYHSLAIGSQ